MFNQSKMKSHVSDPTETYELSRKQNQTRCKKQKQKKCIRFNKTAIWSASVGI